MPYFDGTGPVGQGPRTGRGFGFCGAGRGRGFGRRFFSPKNEINSLKEEEKMLENELMAVREEIKTLEQES
ncbi:MAG: DUF5320 domain-containing protein [Patescibacteria group bacterium]